MRCGEVCLWADDDGAELVELLHFGWKEDAVVCGGWVRPTEREIRRVAAIEAHKLIASQTRKVPTSGMRHYPSHGRVLV